MEVATAYKKIILDHRTEARQRLAFFSFLVTFLFFRRSTKKKKVTEKNNATISSTREYHKIKNIIKSGGKFDTDQSLCQEERLLLL